MWYFSYLNDCNNQQQHSKPYYYGKYILSNFIKFKVSKPELRMSFENFCRQVRLIWLILNESTPFFSRTHAFNIKWSWNLPKAHPCLEVCLIQVENKIFEFGLFQLHKRKIKYNEKFSIWLQYDNKRGW